MREDGYKAYLNKSHVIHCPKIVLQQCTESQPIILLGAGTISQTPEGKLLLDMLSISENPAPLMMHGFSDVKAGQIYPDDSYFKITARDINGREWKSARFIPDSHFGHMNGIRTTGALQNIYSENPKRPEEKANVTLIFDQRPDFPFTHYTEFKEIVGGELDGGRNVLNVAKFEACGLKFDVRKKEDWFEVFVQSEQVKLPNYFDVRVCEALSFVFANNFSPAITIMHDAAGLKTILHSLGSKSKGSLKPFNAFIRDETGSFWKIFEKYLSHIQHHDKPYWHDLTGFVNAIIIASDASLDAQALSVSVAVEGIVARNFEAQSEPTQEVLKQCEILKDLIADSSLDNEFKKRVTELVAKIGKKSAKNKLWNLAKKGLLRKELVDAWGKLRDALAHAESQKPENIKELFRKCHVVQTLFHELIFLTINYNGAYTDYSVEGWPTVQFSSTL